MNDADIFRAIAPRVATIPGGAILLESTPWLETRLTYQLHRDNWTNPTTALVAHTPSVFMLPELAGVVERERLRDPDSAQREFDCASLGSDASAFFDKRTIRDAVDDELPLPSPIPAGELAAIGADVGLVSDSSACAVMSRDREAAITLRALVELKPKKGAPLKLSKVVEVFATVAHAAASSASWPTSTSAPPRASMPTSTACASSSRTTKVTKASLKSTKRCDARCAKVACACRIIPA